MIMKIFRGYSLPIILASCLLASAAAISVNNYLHHRRWTSVTTERGLKLRAVGSSGTTTTVTQTTAPTPPEMIEIPDGDGGFLIIHEKGKTVLAIPPPKDPPPVLMNVPPFTYTIIWGDDTTIPDVFGAFDFNGQIILLQNNMNPGMTREVYLHELLHACMEPLKRSGGKMDKAGNLVGLTEDQFIETISPQLVNFLQNNPEAVEWLKRR